MELPASMQKHHRLVARNIIQVHLDKDCGLPRHWTSMQERLVEFSGAIGFPAMVIVVRDVQRGICTSICAYMNTFYYCRFNNTVFQGLQGSRSKDPVYIARTVYISEPLNHPAAVFCFFIHLFV